MEKGMEAMEEGMERTGVVEGMEGMEHKDGHEHEHEHEREHEHKHERERERGV